jgi:hypothetical protein
MWTLYSPSIDYTVRLRQRNITNYQYRFENPDIWPVLAPDEEELAHITTLQLLLSDSDDCNHATALLESTPSLSSLDILIHRSIMASWGKFSRLRRGPRRLRSLRTENMFFTLGTSTIDGLVELEELEELQLIDCEQYPCLLREHGKPVAEAEGFQYS